MSRPQTSTLLAIASLLMIAAPFIPDLGKQGLEALGMLDFESKGRWARDVGYIGLSSMVWS